MYDQSGESKEEEAMVRNSRIGEPEMEELVPELG